MEKFLACLNQFFLADLFPTGRKVLCEQQLPAFIVSPTLQNESLELKFPLSTGMAQTIKTAFHNIP